MVATFVVPLHLPLGPSPHTLVQDTWWPLLQWVVPLQVCAGRPFIPKVYGGGLACSSSVVLASPTVQEQFNVMLGTERKDTRLRLSHNSCACNIINTSTPGMTHHPGLPSTRRHTSQVNQHPSRALQTEWSNDNLQGCGHDPRN